MRERKHRHKVRDQGCSHGKSCKRFTHIHTVESVGLLLGALNVVKTSLRVRKKVTDSRYFCEGFFSASLFHTNLVFVMADVHEVKKKPDPGVCYLHHLQMYVGLKDTLSSIYGMCTETVQRSTWA